MGDSVFPNLPQTCDATDVPRWRTRPPCSRGSKACASCCRRTRTHTHPQAQAQSPKLPKHLVRLLALVKANGATTLTRKASFRGAAGKRARGVAKKKHNLACARPLAGATWLGPMDTNCVSIGSSTRVPEKPAIARPPPKPMAVAVFCTHARLAGKHACSPTHD